LFYVAKQSILMPIIDVDYSGTSRYVYMMV